MSRCVVFALICAANIVPTASAEDHYDLGGPCKDVAGPGSFSKIQQAKKAGAWDKVVELQRVNVRESCGNEYRWYELVSALLDAHRPAEAVQVLQEMDSRGFDLNPSLIGAMHPGVQKFMDTPGFKASPAGQKIEQLKRVSDERRARYRQILSSLPAGERPPDNYVAKGACPFECCRYGNWIALEDIDLVVAPGSGRVVGRARKGSRVAAITGEVHLKPEPVVVVQDGELPKDSIAFVLDYEGEGFGHVYTRGKVVSAFVGVAEYCLRASDSCWGEMLAPPSDRNQPVWWVKIKLSNGVTGWTDKAGRFGGKDACG